MSELLETLMSKLRKLQLYMAAVAAVLPLVAWLLLKMAEIVLTTLHNVGLRIQTEVEIQSMAAIAILCAIGFACAVLFSRGKHSFQPRHLIGYFGGGCIAFGIIFFVLPMLAHLLVAQVVAPLLHAIASFLDGKARVTVKLVLTYIFLSYFSMFVIEILFRKYVRKESVSQSIEKLLSKYLEEFFEAVRDIFDAVLSLFDRRYRSNKTHE